MTRTKKVYMPLWIAWFTQLFVLPAWGVVTYRTFFGAEAYEASDWMVMTLMIAAVSVMTLLMGYRKLPAYIIEEEGNQK